MTSITPVVLSGGIGTRLWPLSRELFPKQFHALMSERTLFQETVERATGPIFDDPVVICSHDHRFIVAQQIGDMGVRPAEIILEPVGRNTAPAIVISALVLAERTPGAQMLVMPSDHYIRDPNAFAAAVERGSQAAANGKFVTFGIEISQPHTGYGYIQSGENIAGLPGCRTVQAFKEKPNEATAKLYMESGGFYWNSGIFLFPVERFLEDMEAMDAGLVAACRDALSRAQKDLDFLRLDRAAFSACPSISIDYAFMEKTDRAAVVPVEMGWSDVGSWGALWEAMDKDRDGNVLRGDVMAEDTKDSLLFTTGNKLIAAVGMRDVTIVDTDDCVLVAPRERSQDVRNLVERLRKTANRTEHLAHPRIYRPWGWYEHLDVGDRFQVKHIQVNQGGRLSLQKHHHRAEHWVIVYGTAKVTRGDEELLLHENQSTYIPIGCPHRLENPGKVPLQLIEIQSGTYLGEDDIVRLDDVYGRSNE